MLHFDGFANKYNEGTIVAATWSTKEDKERLDKYFYLISKKSPLSDEEKFKLTENFEWKLKRKWNDQTTDVEPYQVYVGKNKKLASGITRDNLVLAGRAGLLFEFQASGTNASKPSIGQHGLFAENARIDAELHAQGNVLRSVARFPTNVASAVICEFGGCDTPFDPSTFSWRTIIESVDDRLTHTQGVTEYTSSHSEVTYSQ